MGKFASDRNFGFGKQMEWAGKQALKDRYGGGRDGTTSTHAGQWRRFCIWVRAVHGIRDARDINDLLLKEYAAMLREKVEDESMEVSYAQNLLSGVNVTLEALRKDSNVRIDSPSDWVGLRSRVRTDRPTGYEWITVNELVTKLRENGLLRAAIVVRLARCFGIRMREAVLADIADWQKQAKKHGKIDVRKGTKGGRGKEIERWVAVSEEGRLALAEAAWVRDQLGCETNLLRPDESFDSLVNDRELNLARRHLHEGGIKGYHDLRAAWACERYQQITGYLAPVLQPTTRIRSAKDRAARAILAPELGHGRIDVVAEYIGSRPRALGTKVDPIEPNGFSDDLLTMQ